MQEGGFFRTAGTPQDGVTVRIAAKAVNDGFVFAFKFDDVRLGVADEGVHSGSMNSGAFAVH